ncbi:MAG: GFA family protein [Pseudomonadota bacterium]
MIEGHCRCGALRWTLSEPPAFANSCNCTSCRTSGALWAYGFEGQHIRVSGDTIGYSPDGGLTQHCCATCGGLGYWRGNGLNDEGRQPMAVNLRLAAPADIADIPLRRFDGRDSWSTLPDDGRTVRDLWTMRP